MSAVVRLWNDQKFITAKKFNQPANQQTNNHHSDIKLKTFAYNENSCSIQFKCNFECRYTYIVVIVSCSFKVKFVFWVEFISCENMYVCRYSCVYVCKCVIKWEQLVITIKWSFVRLSKWEDFQSSFFRHVCISWYKTTGTTTITVPTTFFHIVAWLWQCPYSLCYLVVVIC